MSKYDGAAGGQSPNGDLYLGFEGYCTPSEDELKQALRDALVVFDTNVLLNLYRYNDQTRASIIDVITALGDRFWLPHHVVEEFWRNRERALVTPLTEVKQSLGELDKQLDAAREVLRMWVNRAALAGEAAQLAEDALDAAFSAAREVVEGLSDADEVNRARNTHHDPVLALLGPVLRARVGVPMDDARHADAVAEGQRRAAAGEPPGFADAKKAEGPGGGAAGDYLVWEQLLIEAHRRQLDVVFVTGDVKRDWWRYEGSFARGPRIELAREFARRCGTRLWILRPDALLSQAPGALAVAVQQASVEDVERTTRTETGADARDGDGPRWTAVMLESLLTKLGTVGPVQEATIRLAAQQGGYAGRDDVYRLGEYEPDRQLKGFTRPVNRLVQQLRDAGELSDDASDLLVPVYDKMAHGFGRVDGFRVPTEIVDLLNDQ